MLDVAVKAYLRNARSLFTLVLVIVMPVSFLSTLVLASTYTSSDLVTIDPAGNTTFDDSGAWTTGAGFLVATTLTLLASTLATGACFKAVADAYLGGRSDWRTSLGFVARRFHSIVWISVLGWVLVVLGVLACVVGAVFLYVSFAVAVPVLLAERIRGRRALGRSYRLVKGRWWSSFAVLALAAILAGIVAGIFGALQAGLIPSTDDPTTVLGFLVSWLTDTLASVLTVPFTASVAIVLYFDLRVRKEAFDLQLLASQLGVEPPEGIGPPREGPPASPGDQWEGSRPPFWPPPPGWKPTSPPDPAYDEPPRDEPPPGGDPRWPR
jgi:hypothetical protein